MSNISAVFWDYDNTLLITAQAHWNKHKIVLARRGILLEETHRQRVYENNGNQNWEWMSQELGLKTPKQEYLREVDLEFQQCVLDLDIRPGIGELFELFDSHHIPQAIVTNARELSAKPVLAKKNILPLMRFALFAENYTKRKPDPEPYKMALDKMGELLQKPLCAKNCLAIEDDPKGVESAHLAGLTVIHRRLKKEDPSSIHADYSCFDKEEFISLIKALV